MRMITVRNRDSVFAVMEYSYYKHFKDSINKSTKDTLFVLGKDEVQLRPFNPDNIYVPSVYVIANKDGFIQLKLPEAGQKNTRSASSKWMVRNCLPSTISPKATWL